MDKTGSAFAAINVLVMRAVERSKSVRNFGTIELDK